MHRGQSFAELFALSGLAVAQPVLDVMGRSPDFFLFYGAGRRELVLVAFALVMVVPFTLWLAERLVAAVRPTAGAQLHLLLVVLLIAVLGIQVLKKATGLRGGLLLVVSAVLGVVGVIAYRRFSAARTWLRYMTPAPVAFALAFLCLSQVSALVLPGRTAAASPASSSGAPIVLIAFDEFPLMALLGPDGRIDEELYPNFARFAEGATWFRNATGVSGFTPQALPALLTGLYPDQRVAPVASRFPHNLFTLLARSYRIHAFEAVTALCPRALCASAAEKKSSGGALIQSLANAVDVWAALASPNTVKKDVTASLREVTVREQQDAESPTSSDDLKFLWHRLEANQPARFRDFVGTLGGAQGPSLHFLHLLLPHLPARYLPSGLEYHGPQFVPASAVWTDDAWPSLHMLQRHLLQTVYTDRLLGAVLDQLQRTGMYDRSLVALVADHGAAFGPGEIRREIDQNNVAQLAWVPFFVKAPGQTDGAIIDSNIQTVDLIPTIADIVGVDLPWKPDGSSGFDTPRITGDRPWWDDGERLSFNGDAWFPQVLKGFRVATGPGRGVERLYGIGPHAELLGTRPQDHSAAPFSGAHARIDEPGRYAAVDPGTGIVPALVSGRLERSQSAEARSVVVVVVVNGTIGATSELFRWDNETHRFASMVPERMLRPGSNDLKIFLVRETPARIELEPVEIVM